MEAKQHIHSLRLPQVADLAGVKRHTLNARIKNSISPESIHRTESNQIMLLPDQVRSVLKNEVSDSGCRVIYVGNLKGGVGKTTLTYILADTLSSMGLKVCAADLDVQGNLTSKFIPNNEDLPVFLDLIEGKARIQDLPVKVNDHLDIIPSSLKNSLIQKALTMQTPKHHLTWFNDLCLNYLRSEYDIVLVDTPPNLTTLNSVFCLCLNENDTILVPVAPDEFSIMGVQMFLDDVKDIRSSYNMESSVNIKILMNRFFQTQKSNLETLVKMSELYGELFSGVIFKDFAKIREMMNEKKCVFELKSGKEIYEFIQGLLVDLNIIKGDDENASES